MPFNHLFFPHFSFSAGADSRRGSVLMETVIVLPILLLLFGGLFILGDMAHGRLHLTAVDRAAAWGSDNRFAEPEFKSWLAFVPKTTSLRIERVRADEVLASADDAKSEAAAKAQMLHGNSWLAFYGGYAHAKVAVPFWYGSANAHGILFGGSEEDRFKDEYRLFTYEEDMDKHKAGDYRDFGRSFVVHRRRAVQSGPSNNLDRAAAAANLSWSSVVGDGWCGGAQSPGLGGRAAGRSFRRHPYALLVGE